ncbi:PREDICTED: exportin-T [Condylura cristata]|uniref:exportin-T n=1 Tax=Condylura cristata TaxID=143302 RepID=UPI000642E7DE|nr:PREDICTED: exportin-T [Condylura cristata]
MDEQALLGLNPNADSDFRQRALAYFEQLKISPDAWQVCAEALAQRTYSDDHIKFFCFQVLEHQVKHKYPELTAVQQQLIRETLISWLQAQMLSAQPEKTFIRNKAAQVFALLFVTEYLTRWPKFFFDILSVVDLNPRGVDLYLRILMAVDSELVDRDVAHTSEEARRNTLIKDTMREQCIPNLVESWYQILQNYQYTNSEVTCQCLEVVGAYVSWIDLSLVANDRFLSMLLGHMSVEVLREEACDCLFEIVNKGMDPVGKMKLVESLCQVLQSAGFFNIDQEEDVDFLARFSKLVNGMGQSLIASWTKLTKSADTQSAQEALRAVEAKVALMLQLLVHEDDDISSNIVGFCYDYLHLLKQLPVLSDQQKANVEAIMLAVMKKLTYDEEYNFENEVKILLWFSILPSFSKQMNPFIEDILNRIQDLLELSPPENGYQSLLSSDDQLFIYETAGVLIVNSEYPAERKQALMRNLLTPLMDKFKILLEKLMLAPDEERQASLADCLSHAVGFAR